MHNIRNFCIIAHIDHGKSTLADRFIETTHAVEKRKMQQQLLDTMDLERERGITIKLQPVKMRYTVDGTEYVLNLIDTPGHVDFHYEVNRSLAAVEGAILLVDASQGVQAQTLSNLYAALEQDLVIIPVLNKIDLPNADPEKVAGEIMHILGCAREEILAVSGKTGAGVPELLAEVVRRVPAPAGEDMGVPRALVFDSVYDSYKGVLAYVRVIDGGFYPQDDLYMMATAGESGIVEVGSFRPQLQTEGVITTGDIGYIATGFKSVKECRVGDTVTVVGRPTARQSMGPIAGRDHLPAVLRGYRQVTPMVYASFYPVDGDDYGVMRDALDKLTLNDAAFRFEPESNNALGRGFRCGFLGLLHLEIIQARLEREFDIVPTVTAPSVVYRATKRGGEVVMVYAPSDLPDPAEIEAIAEPYVKLEIITPAAYLGSVMELLGRTRALYKNTVYIDTDRVQLTFDAPLADVIIDLHDQLKSASSGYASMNYEVSGEQVSDLVKMDILIAGDKVEAFSRIVPREAAYREGKAVVEKLKDVLPRQNFAIAIQAAIGSKVLARETLSAYRKDVTAKLYGGDVTRKNKLLDKQKKGKKRMAQHGNVEIPPTAFLAIMKR